MQNQKKPISEWMLERLANGELPAEQARTLRQQLEQEEGGLARLEAIRASNEAILREYPADKMVAEIQRRAYLKNVQERTSAAEARHPQGKQKPFRSFFLVAGPALAMALIVFTVILPNSNRPVVPDPDFGGETTRDKGLQAHLKIYRKTGTVAEALNAQSLAGAGDLLQISYVAGGKKFGAIVSLDGNGNVTLHVPPRGEQAISLQASGEVMLPQAYELDNAPAFERFVLVTSTRSFTIASVVEAARKLAVSGAAAQSAPLELDAEYEQASFLLRKK